MKVVVVLNFTYFRRARFILWFLLVFCCVPTGGAAEKEAPAQGREAPVLFGIAPFMSPLALSRRMAPLREYLTRTLKRPIIIETSTDATEFAARSLSGRYDILFTNPPFALAAMDSDHYRLVVTQERPMVGEIVVLSSSPVTMVEQLAGKSIGAPPKVGFLGHIIESYLDELGMAGDRSVNVRYFHSHHDSISALRVGEIDASFIANFMRPHIESKGISLKVLASSREYPGLTLLVSRRLDDAFAASIKADLLRLGDNAEGRSVLQAISMPPFRIIDRKELETVRPYIPVLNGAG